MSYPQYPFVSLAKVLQSLCPELGWCVENETNIVWSEPDHPDIPTDEQILAKFDELLKEFNDTAYIKNRKQAYNELNQFEMQFNDSMNGTTTWIDAINEIKAKYPKGSVE